MAGEEGLVAVCGSLYLAAQARALPETDKNHDKTHGPESLPDGL